MYSREMEFIVHSHKWNQLGIVREYPKNYNKIASTSEFSRSISCWLLICTREPGASNDYGY